MIKIGVSSCFMYPDPKRNVFGHKTLCYLEKDMANYLSREEVMPVLIPDLEEEDIKRFLTEMDGFVFQGGTDIAPKTYKDEPILEEIFSSGVGDRVGVDEILRKKYELIAEIIQRELRANTSTTTP